MELQRERTDRIKLEQKVMSPRSVQAARMLSQSDGSERFDVRHVTENSSLIFLFSVLSQSSIFERDGRWSVIEL